MCLLLIVWLKFAQLANATRVAIADVTSCCIDFDKRPVYTHTRHSVCSDLFDLFDLPAALTAAEDPSINLNWGLHQPYIHLYTCLIEQN